MNHAQDLAAHVVNNLSKLESSAGAAGVSAAEANTAHVVNAVIKELKACCPAWRLSWLNDSEAEAFRISLTKAFINESVTTVEQLRHMVRWLRTRDSEFLPSIGQIVSRCKPSAEMLGLPNVRAAYLEAANLAHPCTDEATKAKTHPAVFHAATEVGLWELGHLTEKESFPLFKRAYEEAINAYTTGQPLRAPKALPPPEKPVNKERNLEVGRAALAAIRRTLGGGVAKA